MEFLTFEPSEFQVLEDFTFDEPVQREERVRFYTLEEQTVDAFERLLPKGRITKYATLQLQYEVERYTKLYTNYVVQTPEDYGLREPEYSKSFSWVYPVYATSERKEYSFGSSWAPLYDNVNLPNFYPRMISALPHPFLDTPEGGPYPLTETTEFLNKEGRNPQRALPEFLSTRTQRHENGKISILKVPIEGSADRVNFVGYYLAKRPLDIPNPLAEHPFLKANESTFLESTAPFKDVAPSLDAVLTHAIPVTTDPYRVAEPYLKLYDVRLSDIPWSSWRSKFPPAEMIPQVQEEVLIEFPKGKEFKPSEKLVDEYRSPYDVGVSSRKWLMDQLDGGDLVIQMLLSKAIDNGSVVSIPGIDLPLPSFPETTMEECALLGTSFQDFTIRGNLRRVWTWNEKKSKDSVSLTCVPLEFVKQERAREGYTGRSPWKETTGTELLDAHRKRLHQMLPILPIQPKSFPQAKITAKGESPQRREILAIQNDVHRLVEDKVRDIQDLLKDATLTTNIYSDPEGLFVFCGHTLAVLVGDFAKDKDKFFQTWTGRDGGFRVCKFCGERVSGTDLEDQVEFTEDGYAIRRTDALTESVFQTGNIAGYTTGLRAIQPIFLLDDASDSTCFLVMSILQVLPEAAQVEPILKLGRAFLTKQYGNKDSDDIKGIKGVVGILLAILILQTHSPRLIPRRSFGSKPLILSGYPRDAPEPADYSILDTMIMVVRRTFEAYPTSFKGPSQQVIRNILNKPKDVKKNMALLLKKVFLVDKDVKALLLRAKEENTGIVETEQPRALIPVVPTPTEFDVITQFPTCPSARPILVYGGVPKVVQQIVPLRQGIHASRLKKDLEASPSVRVALAMVDKETIRERFKKKSTALPVVDSYRTNLVLASRLADLFLLPQPIMSINPDQKIDELRDIAKGFVYELLNEIQADPIKRKKLADLKSKDITIYMLLADFKKEKAQVNSLRAQERLKFVDEMGRKSDQERELIGDLLKIGMAPYIITNRDREAFAKQAESLSDQTAIDDDFFNIDQEVANVEIGVGLPQDFQDQGDAPAQGADAGNYGDYNANPSNDGRDHYQTGFEDDERTTI